MGKKKKAVSASSSIHSPNFGFLAGHDQLLVELGAYAERYVFDDPNASLIKMRQLAEALARNTAAIVGIDVSGLPQIDVIRKLVDRRYLPDAVAGLFHTIRMSGNNAAHHFEGSQSLHDALMLLQVTRSVAVWFHQTFKDQRFKPGPFQAPPDPKDLKKETKALTEELERLRLQSAIHETEARSAKDSAAIEAVLRQEAEARAETAYKELDFALELAEESEQKLQSELKRFDERLAAIESEAEKRSAADIEKIVAGAEKAASHLDLSEAEMRRVAETDLRDGGQEVMKPVGKPVEITVPAILFRITKVYREGMTPNEVYEAVRGTWKVDDRRNGARYAFAVYEGAVKGVFEIKKWHLAGTTSYQTRIGGELKTDGRWEFIGNYADQRMWFEYLGRSVAAYFPAGSPPIKYVNC